MDLVAAKLPRMAIKKQGRMTLLMITDISKGFSYALIPISLPDTLTHLLTLNHPDLRSKADLLSSQVLLSTPPFRK